MHHILNLSRVEGSTNPKLRSTQNLGASVDGFRVSGSSWKPIKLPIKLPHLRVPNLTML